MKKYIFVFIAVILILCLYSCPTEVAKKTYWEGSINGDFGDSSTFDTEHDLELYIHDDNTCRIVLIINYANGASSDYGLNGDYELNNNDYSFEADLADSDESIEAEIEGTLNTVTGISNGKIKLIDSSNSSYSKEKFEIYRRY